LQQWPYNEQMKVCKCNI